MADAAIRGKPRGPVDDSVRSPDDDGEYFARVMLAGQGIRASTAGRYYYRKFKDVEATAQRIARQIFEGDCIP